MKVFSFFFCLILSCSLFSQSSIETLKKELAEATDTRTKMVLNYELAEAYLTVKAKEAASYARDAHELASDLNNDNMAGQAAFLRGLALTRSRDLRNAEVWFKTALKYAKSSKDPDLIIKSVNERSKLAIKNRNYRRAYEINQEAFDYFSKRGNSIGDLDLKNEKKKARFAREQREMDAEKLSLEEQLQNLRREKNLLAEEKDILKSDKSYLEARQKELVKEKETVEAAITEKEEALASVEEDKEKAERRARRKERRIKVLSKEAMADSLELIEKNVALQYAELEATKNRNYLNLLILISLFIIVLAILFYSRLRANRKAKIALQEKNKIIEEERHRSDELLLNILPAPIAHELKENGKASAQKYNYASVLFSDFKNFTKIAEKLTPEALVKELDYCFKAFDFIISQYDSIEKIKTIGDAYMCATGLTSRKTMPVDLVKAALEIQEFLEEYKLEKIRKGEPYFEARIGIHTGPVVAGVVGVKKFAYDIWGDTVNVAARMESKCEEGKVNISESTYNLVKYKFDCIPRGKMTAKNLGPIEMYYVKKAV